eukprot:CAMPEP_0183338162 /NCGR_PEP_ID=MMETSP0164_2-20130417/5556_1 /TAXON_ID=221442 /ORGANISM="Coccolithus pelagicus ssp braarudi, Strain PLY182g" /LENGTH=123 /DNA_ID=CAMNT_0025507971 /DNA_START=282 /DNA_END=653 /DNA_ORIENTATION=+
MHAFSLESTQLLLVAPDNLHTEPCGVFHEHLGRPHGQSSRDAKGVSQHDVPSDISGEHMRHLRELVWAAVEDRQEERGTQSKFILPHREYLGVVAQNARVARIGQANLSEPLAEGGNPAPRDT